MLQKQKPRKEAIANTYSPISPGCLSCSSMWLIFICMSLKGQKEKQTILMLVPCSGVQYKPGQSLLAWDQHHILLSQIGSDRNLQESSLLVLVLYSSNSLDDLCSQWYKVTHYKAVLTDLQTTVSKASNPNLSGVALFLYSWHYWQTCFPHLYPYYILLYHFTVWHPCNYLFKASYRMVLV